MRRLAALLLTIINGIGCRKHDRSGLRRLGLVRRLMRNYRRHRVALPSGGRWAAIRCAWNDPILPYLESRNR